MANAYNSTTQLAALFQNAFDRNMRLALRGQPQYRAIADVKPVNQTNPGDSVAFTFYGDLAEVTTALNEITDPDSVALPNPTQISVTLAERGNYTVTTMLAKTFAIDPTFVGKIANILAYNQAASLDSVVQSVLAGASKQITNIGGVPTLTTGAAVVTGVTPTDVLSSSDIRLAVTTLRSANVVPLRGDYYGTYLHPQCTHDLRAATGAADWRTPKDYTDPAGLYAGEIGLWEGSFFVETSRAASAQVGSGSGGTETRVFNTFTVGQECLGEAVAEEPHVVLDGVVVDPLKRKMAVGWYGILGWGLMRPEALIKINTSSSVRTTV